MSDPKLVSVCENIGDAANRPCWSTQPANIPKVGEDKFVLEESRSSLLGFASLGSAFLGSSSSGPIDGDVSPGPGSSNDDRAHTILSNARSNMALIEYPNEPGAPESSSDEYANEPGVPELDDVEYATEFEPRVPEIAEQDQRSSSLGIIEGSSPKKVINLSPVKMIKTVMSLSNVFRNLNLKRSVELEGDWAVSKKKQKVVDVDQLKQQENEVMCLDFNSCMPHGRRKYKKRVRTRSRKRTTQTSVVIREVEVLHDVPIEFEAGGSDDCPATNKVRKLEYRRKKMGFEYGDYVEPDGLTGGLALWAKRKNSVVIRAKGKNFIDSWFCDDKGVSLFRVIWVYAPVDYYDRQMLWRRIEDMVNELEVPCICLGDFNDILDQAEILGGKRKAHRNIASFRDFISCCNFIDMPSQGQQFTWSCIRGGEVIQEKLDCVLGNSDWIAQNPRCKVINLPAIGSDHSPIVCFSDFKSIHSKRIFKFEAMWVEHQDYGNVVKEGWKKEIEGSKTFQGEWVDEEKDIRRCFTGFFENLYTSCGPRDWKEVLSYVPKMITDEMNMELTRDFSIEEIKEATFQLGKHKSPGPDGFNGLFFQEYWSDVGPSIVDAVKSFFHSGRILKELNKTFIVLIPKIKAPEEVSQFRPISLCNFVYKIISKLMVNRLKKWLEVLITQNQNAFLEKRQIQDNIIVAHEAFHYLKLRKNRKRWDVAIKLDMQKAYDRIEWDFLEAVLQKMGFDEKWINWTMECVSTVRYSVVINGEPEGNINPTRGLRQGDPLSPYLFLFIVDVLSRMIIQETEGKQLSGMKLCRAGPEITHLIFVDDSLFFLKGSEKNCDKLKELIMKYCAASGQQVNLSKSSLIFSSNTPEDVKTTISNRVGIPIAANPGTYLGNPAATWGKTRKEALHFVKERVLSRIQGWKQKMLSQGGREILLKAVASAIPTYFMSCLKFPISLCKEMSAGMARFWWGQQNDEGRIHWYWRITQNPDALWVKVLKGIYFPNCDVTNARRGGRASWMWSSILNGRDFMEKELRWRVANGENISVTDDRWIPKLESGKIDLQGGEEHCRALKSKILLMQMLDVGTSVQLNNGSLRNNEVETIEHLLLKCDWTQVVWFGTMGYRCDNADLQSARCDLIFNGKKLDPLGTTIAVQKNGELKINMDGAWDKETGKGGYGVIARMQDGSVIDGITRDGQFSSALHTEAVAIREAATIANKHGNLKVVFESDSQELVKAILSDKNGRWEIDSILEDFRQITAQLKSFSIRWISRKANAATDWLASYARQGMCTGQRGAVAEGERGAVVEEAALLVLDQHQGVANDSDDPAPLMRTGWLGSQCLVALQSVT
ncbi:reverse transcriptase [Corchorus capsularis]|uniref:Reverse transcriptase n=1 Tax=Corchorus capsularis TaxID=210143 RepID=A0A1R3J422_COCAP|nr:reverse transcriptase [Corchorus capsularis]